MNKDLTKCICGREYDFYKIVRVYPWSSKYEEYLYCSECNHTNSSPNTGLCEKCMVEYKKYQYLPGDGAFDNNDEYIQLPCPECNHDPKKPSIFSNKFKRDLIKREVKK
ncbi:Uncharacterised protein [uncultured archaeon]|nr:Uncharacterised protein [uncultured archaeon]